MCAGEPGSRWSTTLQQCVAGTPSEVCDSIRRTTCYIGRHRQALMAVSQMILDGGLPTAKIRWDAYAPLPAVVEYVGDEWVKSGLREGDRIVSVGNNLASEAVLRDLHAVEQDLSVIVWRDGAVHNLTLSGSNEVQQD